MKIDALSPNQLNMEEVAKADIGKNIQNQLQNQGFQLDDNKKIIDKDTLYSERELLKDPEELKKLIKELTSKLSYLNSQLKIEIDSEINKPIVKIMDINTNQVIRQIPPDYLLNIIKNINKLLGVLFEEKV